MLEDNFFAHLVASMKSTVDLKLLFVQIDYEDPYVQPLWLKALKSRLPESSYRLVIGLPHDDDNDDDKYQLLQIRQYESIAFDLALRKPHQVLVNAYVIRKAMIRKHFLAATVANWIKKNPQSILATNVEPAYDFELDYAEFLDEALTEAFEMRASLAKNAELPAEQRQWWILKPSMAEGAHGIRLFSTEDELAAIFEQWEADEGSDEEELGSNLPDNYDTRRVITSQLRHFVAQPYIHPPLLLADLTKRKFHIRTYVLAVGALSVYVYRPMLALFAAAEYSPPWTDPNLQAHLTNTCLQGTSIREGSVRAFWELEDHVPSLPLGWKDKVFHQICEVTGEVFEAAARSMMVHFQTLPCSFELFGLDFLVDAGGKAWFLEVNAFPDFKQTGDDLKELVSGLFEEVMDIAVKPFFNIESTSTDAPIQRIVKVLDIDQGRR
jgi:tubulin---tyrosine ligase